MKQSSPGTMRKSRMTEQKSSGITSHKPKEVAEKSRQDKNIPADRGAYTPRSSNEGSE